MLDSKYQDSGMTWQQWSEKTHREDWHSTDGDGVPFCELDPDCKLIVR